MAQIVIADNQELMCEGVRHFLRDQPAINVVADVRSESALLSLIRECSHDIDAVLLEPQIANTTDVEMLRHIRSIRQTLPILVFTAREEDAHAVNLIKAGAQGYLNKRCSPQQLSDAVRKVVSGRMYVSEKLAEFLAKSVMRPLEVQDYSSLSERERDVFTRLVAGYTVTQVAQQLKLSVKTVSTHKARIMNRMDFRSLSEMVQYAIVNGLMDLADDVGRPRYQSL